MPWTIIHGRQRELFVMGVESGKPTFTRDPVRALRFANQIAARKWIQVNTITGFGALALMREKSTAPKKLSPERGLAGAQIRNQHDESTATVCRRA
jgi:hypothetical protein